jgi:hypothetical protein
MHSNVDVSQRKCSAGVVKVTVSCDMDHNDPGAGLEIAVHKLGWAGALGQRHTEQKDYRH